MSDRIEQQLRAVFNEQANVIDSTQPDPVPAIERRMRQRVRRQVAASVAAVVAVGAAVTGALAGGSHFDADRDTTPVETPSHDVQPGSGEDRAFLFDLDTGQATLLPLPRDGSFGHDMSPDGTQLAYSVWRDPTGPNLATVYVSLLGENPDDGAISTRPATPPTIGAFGPQWSPDGSRLVYQQVHRRPGAVGVVTTGELAVVDVATGKTTTLTHASDEMFLEQDWFMSPSFSPDGRSILYHQLRTEHGVGWDLWSVPATGGKPSLVVRNAAYGAYSPDGSTIAYLDSPQTPTPDTGTHPLPGPGPGESPAHAIWLADPNGSNPRRLVQGEQIHSPMWSPDGTRIAYADGDATWVVDVGTGETHQVANGQAEAWYDDDTLIMAATSPEELQLQ